MGRQSMIGLGAAVLLGLLAVFLANTYLVGSEQRAALSGTTKVAVAAVPLAYGVNITPASASSITRTPQSRLAASTRSRLSSRRGRSASR